MFKFKKRPDLKDDGNKKVLGKFKDEMNSLIIKEFTALNPKVYSINHQTLNACSEMKHQKQETLRMYPQQ